MKDVIKRVYSIKETCYALGISRPTVMRLIETKKLGHIRVGHRIIIPISDVDQYIKENTIR